MKTSIILDAFTINIFELNYVYSSPIFSRFLKGIPNALPRKGFLIRIGAYFIHLIKLIKPRDWSREGSISPNSILFFITSKNQRDCIKPIATKIKTSYVIGNKADFTFSFTFFLAYLFSIPFLPIILYQYLRSSGLKKLSFCYNLDRYWLTYGYYIACRLWLKTKKPQMMILANDHLMECRTMLKACKDEGIITAYIPHASVTKEFPALAFDYAFLEGKDSLETYSKIGKSKTKVYLVGSPKFDLHQRDINNKTKLGSLGICTNSFDPIDQVEKVITAITNKYQGVPISLRPHPSDRRFESWKKLSQEWGIYFSNSRIEGGYEFLNKVDCVIAGNSNIHLEAVLINVYPIYYDFAQSPDLIEYSFITNGLCEYYYEINPLLKKIDSLLVLKENIRSRAKRYNDTLGTTYDGFSSELISRLILDITQNSKVNPSGWINISNNMLETYSKKESRP
jgi:hypothetical protein